MNKKTYFTILGLCLSIILGGCNSTDAKKNDTKAKPAVKVEQKAGEAKTNTAPAAKAEQKSEAKAAPASAPKKVEVTPESFAGKPYVVAKYDLSNLQLDDPSKPVYDLLSVKERRAKGLPTQLPELKPYNNGKIAYLTFDDGPDGKNTPAILDILKAEGVKATFYVVGPACYSHPDQLLRMFTEGHAIGNHSYTHDYDKLYPNVNNFLDEMFGTEKVMREILGFRSFIIRAPGGKYGQFTSAYPPALKSAGLVEHDWNVCIDDAVGGHPTAADFVNKVDKQTANGKQNAIVLMHCAYGKEETVKALPQIIQLLRNRGYKFGVVTPMTPQPY